MRQFHLAIYKRGVEFIATELGRAKGKPSNSAGLQIRCADNSLTIQAAQYLWKKKHKKQKKQKHKSWPSWKFAEARLPYSMAMQSSSLQFTLIPSV